MTEEITIRQTSSEGTSAVPSAQEGTTGGARRGAERKINRYLYENLLCHFEGQIECWNRRAVRDPNPEAAQAFSLKAEGLGYALRVLYACKPEFEELVRCAETVTCKGCGAELVHAGLRLSTDSDLCDSCYEIGRDGQSSIAESAGDSVPLTNLAVE